ncbi:TetR/AcrR family transcriptional regulator [Desulfothermus okinawensis]
MDTRTKILKAARLEFAKNGFHTTLVSDIAKRAGVGKGTIYRYFPSKEDLFGSIIQQKMMDFETNIKKIISGYENEAEILRRIGKLHFEEYRRSKDVIAILVMEGLNKIEGINQEFKNSILSIQNLVSGVVARGIERSIFREIDPEKTAVLFLSLIWTILKHGIFMEEKDLERKYCDVIFDLFFHGILK